MSGCWRRQQLVSVLCFGADFLHKQIQDALTRLQTANPHIAGHCTETAKRRRMPSEAV
jgi:hypothetical protein